MAGPARALLNLVFPPRCLGCRTLGTFLCPACAAGVSRLVDPFCPTCGLSVDPAHPQCRCRAPALSFVVAAGEFDGPLRQAIRALKYQGQRAGAPALAGLLAPHLAGILEPDHLLVPVPLHPRRLRQRGYNQSALLARALTSDRAAPPDERALRRIRQTTPQVELRGEQRARNMAGAFTGDSSRCGGRTIVLVDDVCTTGATLRAAAGAATAAGARRVYAAVLAATQ